VDVTAEDLDELLAEMKQYAADLSAALRVRLDSGPLLHAFGVIEPDMYRKSYSNGETMPNDGVDDALMDEVASRFDVLIDHFGRPRKYTGQDGAELEAEPLIDSDGIRDEQRAFALYMKEKAYERTRDNKLLTLRDIWTAYSSDIKEKFPCISILFEISLVLPLSNAVVERIFSTMNLMHSKIRNNMDVVTVEAEMMVNLEGPANHTVGLPNCEEIWDIWFRLPNGDRWGNGAHSQQVAR
jgi:hypothetical protein